jgi:N-methylhydantoinase A
MMSKILRIVSVERGYDPRNFALVAFGGAGPMHVCALAEELRISNIVVPLNPGMFSALGLLTADLFHDYSRPVLSSVDSIEASRLEELFNGMKEEGKDTLESENVSDTRHRYHRTLDMRYHGQGYELNIETETPFTERSKNKAVLDFNIKHNEVYGYSDEDESVEIVNAKLRVIGLLDSPTMKPMKDQGEAKPRTTRRVFYETNDEWHTVKVFDRTGIGLGSTGPAIIEQYDSTTVVYPNWSFRPDNYGNLILRRKAND